MTCHHLADHIEGHKRCHRAFVCRTVSGQGLVALCERQSVTVSTSYRMAWQAGHPLPMTDTAIGCPSGVWGTARNTRRTYFSIPTKKVLGRKPGGTMKYGSMGFEGRTSRVSLAVSLRSFLELLLSRLMLPIARLELLAARLCDELPTQITKIST